MLGNEYEDVSIFNISLLKQISSLIIAYFITLRCAQDRYVPITKNGKYKFKRSHYFCLFKIETF